MPQLVIQSHHSHRERNNFPTREDQGEIQPFWGSVLH